jgi:hypothetical protein
MYERTEIAAVSQCHGNPRINFKNHKKQTDKLKNSCKGVTKMTAIKITRIRVLIMKKLERMLARCTEHQHRPDIPLSAAMSNQAKAKSLLDNNFAILKRIPCYTMLKLTHFP